ncbi:MAG: potassium channel family protein [archaeon]
MAEIIIDSKTKLILAVVFVIFLLGTGTLVFHKLEQWGYIDSFYFTTVTLTTIGYGDLVPHTDMGKLITSAFAILGVGTFLFALSVIAQSYFDKRLKKFKDHPLKRKTEEVVNGTTKTITQVAHKSIHHVKKLKFNKENLLNQKEHKVFERK